MDFVSLTFYGVVCGALSLFAPSLKTTLSRFGIGALVGIISALTLPFVRGVLPY